MLCSVTMLVTFVGLGLPAGLAGIPWALLTGDIGVLYRWSMHILLIGVKLARIRVEVEVVSTYPHSLVSSWPTTYRILIRLSCCPCFSFVLLSLSSVRCSKFLSSDMVCASQTLSR